MKISNYKNSMYNVYITSFVGGLLSPVHQFDDYSRRFRRKRRLESPVWTGFYICEEATG